MKRPHRDTTVFSLSALDLFCSAMGVFMVLCFIALPSFTKQEEAPVEAPTPPAEAAPPPAPVVLESLMVRMEWTKQVDVDMYLLAPNPANPGKPHLFGWNRKTNAGSQALLLHDTRSSAGSEIWVDPVAPPGKYEVYCVVFRNGAPEGGCVELAANEQPEMKMTLMSARMREDFRFKANKLSKQSWNRQLEYDHAFIDFVKRHFLHVATIEVKEGGDVTADIHCSRI